MENSNEDRKKQRADYWRALRLVKTFENASLPEDCPVRLLKGCIFSDRVTGGVFAQFEFQNVSQQPIKSVDINLSCYLNQNIPYTDIRYIYSKENLTFGVISKDGDEMTVYKSNKREYIYPGECFGKTSFIPLPETYFTKIKVTLCRLSFKRREDAVINIPLAAADNKYDESERPVYYKNPAVTRVPTRKTNMENKSDFDKSKYNQSKKVEKIGEAIKKEMMFQKAMKNIADDEEYENRHKLLIVPNMILFVGLFHVLIFIIKALITVFYGE